jgi:hypothetical protein
VVDGDDQGVEGVHQVLAIWREKPRIKVPVTKVAFSFDSLVKLVINKTEPVSHVELSRLSVILVVSDWVSHHDALELWNVGTCVVCDILIHKLGKFRNIYPSIRLTSNVDVICLKLWEVVVH